MASPLQNNITNLQSILNMVNNLPNGGNGTQLPTLSNAGTASDLASGKQLIDASGNVITGTHTCSSGGTTVQKETGSISVSSQSTTTITCGFRPDVVVIHGNTYSASGTTYNNDAVVYLETAGNSRAATTSIVNYSSTITWATFDITATTTGFKAYYEGLSSSLSQVSGRFRGTWTAIKYT